MSYGTVSLTALSPSGAQSVAFDYDPEETAFEWPERLTVIEGIGSTTVQQWLPRSGDCAIRIKSGTQWISRSNVSKMYQNRGLRAAQFRYQDSEGNDMTVMIEHWAAQQARGMPALYEYECTLRVLGITKLLNETYSGD
jgi:hypothetical protein